MILQLVSFSRKFHRFSNSLWVDSAERRSDAEETERPHRPPPPLPNFSLRQVWYAFSFSAVNGAWGSGHDLLLAETCHTTIDSTTRESVNALIALRGGHIVCDMESHWSIKQVGCQAHFYTVIIRHFSALIRQPGVVEFDAKNISEVELQMCFWGTLQINTHILYFLIVWHLGSCVFNEANNIHF